MISRIDSLASQLESGSWLPEDDSHQYRQIFHGTYRVIYRFANDTVVIVAIHHSARQFDIEVL
jgi:plasmid stabilization system protein ParE